MVARGIRWSCMIGALVGAVAATAVAEGVLGAPVTLDWDANPEPDLSGYIVHVGTTSGVYAESYDVGNVTSFIYRNGIGGRRYYFTVSAYTPGPLHGPYAAEVSTIIRELATPSPSGGIVLQPAIIVGSTVRLTWAAVGGLSVSEYLIEAGTASGLTDIYNGSVGPLTSVSAAVRDGPYYVRVRGRDSPVSSTVSNEVSFSVGAGCTTPPHPPTKVKGWVAAGLASVTWTDAPGATSYVVQAGSSPRLADLFHGNVGATHLVSAPVLPGFTAYVRIVAVNSCGQSVASTEVFLH